MRRRLLFLLIPLAIVLQSHEFWIQPSRYHFEVGDTTTLRFRVGENLVGEPWMGKSSRVTRLDLVNAKGSLDVRNAYSEGKLKLTFQEPGTHIVSMESNEAFSKLDGEAFNKYLEEDGLHDALDLRTKNGVLNDSASELYSRHTKLFLQVGKAIDSNYSPTLGHTFEIVPSKNPMTYKKGDRATFKLLYNGKPAFGVKVLCTNRLKSTVHSQSIYTQQDGTIELPIAREGKWLVSGVKMESATGRAQWRSYWASVMFETK